MDISLLLLYLSGASGALPFIFAVNKFKLVNKLNPPFAWLIAITLVVEMIAIFLFYNKANNMWLYYSYTVVEFALLTASLQRMQYQKIPVAFTGILILLMTGATLADALKINGLQQYNSFSRSVECLLLIGLSLFSFYDLIKYHVKQNTHLTASPLFWLALAILVYMAGNLFVFAVTNILSANNDPAYAKAWVIHSVLNILYNIILVNVVLCLKKAPSYTT